MKYNLYKTIVSQAQPLQPNTDTKDVTNVLLTKGLIQEMEKYGLTLQINPGLLKLRSRLAPGGETAISLFVLQTKNKNLFAPLSTIRRQGIIFNQKSNTFERVHNNISSLAEKIEREIQNSSFLPAPETENPTNYVVHFSKEGENKLLRGWVKTEKGIEPIAAKSVKEALIFKNITYHDAVEKFIEIQERFGTDTGDVIYGVSVLKQQL